MKPLDRSGVIRQSVSVLICGIAGFLPVIGLFPAVSAVVNGLRIRRAYPGPNPVDGYRRWGLALGIFCVLLNVCAVIIFIVNIISAATRGYWIDIG